MAVETADDLATFFNVDEFAASAVYTAPGGGGGVSCAILVDLREPGAEPGMGRPLTSQGSIVVQKVEIAAPAQDGVFVVAAGRFAGTYTIADRPLAGDDAGATWSMQVFKS